jgi:hypothetical protein
MKPRQVTLKKTVCQFFQSCRLARAGHSNTPPACDVRRNAAVQEAGTILKDGVVHMYAISHSGHVPDLNLFYG